MKLNENFTLPECGNLFSDATYMQGDQSKKVIRLGTGEATQPLAPAVVAAMQAAVAQMSTKATFKGYAPEQGCLFLREAIEGYYAARGVAVPADDIFINGGAKGDLSGILEVFSAKNTVLLLSPAYPLYVNASTVAGHKIIYAHGNEENAFLPLPNYNVKADIIFICSPNNPTGAVYNHAQLAQWVSYALKQKAVILFDAAYEAFIKDESLPRSIYEIEGASRCAIEFCSLSKTAGFTGVRCGYTIIPEQLTVNKTSVKQRWLLRQKLKHITVPYIIQRGAEAVFTPVGAVQVQATLNIYRQNATLITETLQKLKMWFTGGENSPYIWLKCQSGMTSEQFFESLLNNCGIVSAKGNGFGGGGEGFVRLTAFADKAATEIAMKNLKLYEYS